MSYTDVKIPSDISDYDESDHEDIQITKDVIIPKIKKNQLDPIDSEYEMTTETHFANFTQK